MHTATEWHSHAMTNMSHASSSQRRASKQCDSSRRSHEETVSQNLNMYNEVHGTLEVKVQTSNRLIEKLQHRADSVEKTIEAAKFSLAQLVTARSVKEPPLQLCQWRMQERERRPLREQVHDHVEVALEDEKNALMQTQKSLSEAGRKTKEMIMKLESKLEELRYDLDQKRQALGVDEMCLRTAHRSYQTVVDRSPRARSETSSRLSGTPRRSSSGLQAAHHESSKNEVARQQEATRLSQRASERERMAKDMIKDNNSLIARCERTAQEAAARSERSFQDRINENQQMRRRLANEIRETHGKIQHTNSTIAETRMQIKALVEPADLCTTCSSWRKQRATKEHITDPVSTRLVEHQAMLLRSHEELKSHHQSEKSALQDLHERLEQLKDDLRDKTASLRIDMNCLAHEAVHQNGKPSKMLSKSRVNKALKMDPGFIPSASGSSFSLPPAPLTAR